MRADVKAACEALAAKLKAPEVGLVADINPEALNPPCAWITPREIRDFTLNGGGTLVAWVYLIAPDVETPRAMSLLDDALEGLLEVADIAESDNTVDLAAAVLLPTNPAKPLPAYRVAVDLDL